MNAATTIDWTARAASRFPKTAANGGISGFGRYVVGIACGGAPKIYLYETRDEQQKRIEALDKRGCGNSCVDLHDLFELSEA
jgi:hypothetical protein